MKISKIFKGTTNKLLIQGLTDTNYYFIANLGSKLISFLIIPFITRMVGVKDFAIYDLFILSSGLLSMVTGLGMDSGSAILITENRDNEKNLKTIFSLTIFSSFLTLCVIWLFVTFYNVYFAIPYLSPAIVQMIFVSTLLTQINYSSFNFIRWFGKARKAALLNVLSSVSGTVLGFTLLSFQEEKSIEVFLFGLIAGTALGTLASIIITQRFYTFSKVFKSPIRGDLLRLSLPFIPTYLGNYLMQIADRLIVTYFFGIYPLGLYALCNRISQIPNLLLQIISKGFQPILLSNYQSPEGKKLNRQLFSFFWLSTIPFNVVLILMARPLVLIFGGENYLEAVPIIPFVVNATICFGAFYLFGYSFSIKRKTIYVSIITGLTVLTVYSLSLLLIPILEVKAIAVAAFISSATGAILYIYASEKLYSFNYRLSVMWLAILVNSSILVLFYNL